MRHSSARWLFLDALFVSLLILYLLAGMTLAPFHGDESSTIYMSQDWYWLTHDISQLFYRDPPLPGNGATNQQLRLINGPLSYYIVGSTWTLAGLHLRP